MVLRAEARGLLTASLKKRSQPLMIVALFRLSATGF